jgi:tellurite resistance protein
MASLPFDVLEAQEIVRALAAVAAADGAIVAREVAFLDGFANPYRLNTATWYATPLDEAALARAVTAPERRREVLSLCVQMAICDRRYAPEEVAVIERIAVAFGVAPVEITAITEAATAK